MAQVIPMPDPVAYTDFEIRLDERDDGHVEAQVLESPWGRGSGEFRLPFSRSEIEPRILAVEREVVESFKPPDPEVSIPEISMRDFGSQLFDALVPPGQVRTAFDASRGLQFGLKGTALRLRISFPPRHLSGPLAALPWELLYYEERFLGRVVKLPIVRSIDAAGPMAPFAVKGPLRILVVESQPKDKNLLDLDAKSEIRAIGKAIKRLESEGLVEVEILRRPSLLALKEKMREGEFHVLHYIGHAYFDERNSTEGCLLFEDSRRKMVPAWSEVLGDLLRGFDSLRLVVLNSCRTAAFPRRDAESAVGGVAAALAARALPAVVAMQFPISDRAAIRFSQSFYRALTEGQPIDAAVSDAREDLWLWKNSSYEWINPVIFLRGKEACLFEDIRPAEPKKAGRSGDLSIVRTAESVDAPIRLGFISFGPDPWGEVREKSDHVLDLCEFFGERYIRDPKLWNAEVYPRLREFLKAHLPRGGRPVVVDFAAHLSVAYAVGTLLEVKSGLDVTVIQRGKSAQTGEAWSRISKPETLPYAGPSLWLDEPDRVLDGEVADTALAVGISNPVFEDVEVFLSRSQTRVGRILPATIAPEPSNHSVRDGSHAFELAHQIARRVRGRSYREREATLHLFISSPNAVVFYLGQLAGTFGDVQLYEHAFRDPTRRLKYEPSLRLPTPPSAPDA